MPPRAPVDAELIMRPWILEELASRRSSEEISHPLEDEHSEWRKKQEEFLHSESHYWLEWRFME